MTEKKRTGFALLSEEKRRELGSKGGKLGKGHRFTPEEARANARKAGLAGVAAKRRRGDPLFTVNGPGHKFNSETARKASERNHDLRAKEDPEVEWVEGAKPQEVNTPEERTTDRRLEGSDYEWLTTGEP